MKQKKCKWCKVMFEPIRPFQQCCTYQCAMKLGKLREDEKKIKEIKQETKELKEKWCPKKKGDYEKEAQEIFNKYIRKRDVLKGCVSCGADLSKNKFDAGHYISVKQSNNLRYNEFNVNGQCVHCNQHNHGAIVNYRIGLICRIGTEQVELLEANRHKECKRSIEDLKELIEIYKRKVKELQ